jgi:hypothetical protein
LQTMTFPVLNDAAALVTTSQRLNRDKRIYWAADQLDGPALSSLDFIIRQLSKPMHGCTTFAKKHL